MKILIADDDPISLRMLEAILVKWGYEVVKAEDGEEAWRILQGDDAPRLAILDWLMPGIDGVDVCRKARTRAQAPYAYLILLTSKDRKEEVIEGMEAGADDYLIKPFDPHRLQVRLRAGRRILDLQSALLSSLDELARVRRQEAEIGARIQRTLLLGQPPRQLCGARLAALTIPSQHVDGDFYDFFVHRSTAFDVLVGDVMGKGIPAALLGAAIKSHFLRALSHLLSACGPGTLPEPEEIVSSVHAEVTRQFIGLEFFATLCYARFDLAARKITFVDGGHTKTVHLQRRTGKIAMIEGDNLPLGCSENEIYRQVAHPFDPGDLFFFYSDGVTEARNQVGELFGEERLVQVIQAHSDFEPAALIEAVRSAVVAFSQSETFADDLTCVAVKIDATEEEFSRADAELEVPSSLRELATIRRFVRDFCQSLAAPTLADEALALLELAISEAASNVMRHAYPGRSDGKLRIEAAAFADRISLRLYDWGEPFDTKAVRQPAFDGSRDGGFGVYIIARSVDAVHYSHDPDGANCIHLIKNLEEGNRYGTDARQE